MKKYGIIGFPLTHSFSKQYFTEKFEKENITDAVYYTFPLSSIEDFQALLKANPELKGLSVTIPFKEQVLKYVNHLSKEVVQIGATNCIKISGNKLTAYNTDIIGFEKSFVKKLKPENRKALVLGNGGASKAVQYVLKKQGIDFLVVTRSENKPENFILYSQLTKNIMEEFTVIINCTPLGMTPDETTCPDIPYSYITSRHYLFDLVYKPAQTLFLSKGQELGAVINNGYEMLILQAEANWKIWNEDRL